MITYDLYFPENPCVTHTGFLSIEEALEHQDSPSLRGFRWTPMVYEVIDDDRDDRKLVYDGRPENKRGPINPNEW